MCFLLKGFGRYFQHRPGTLHQFDAPFLRLDTECPLFNAFHLASANAFDAVDQKGIVGILCVTDKNSHKAARLIRIFKHLAYDSPDSGNRRRFFQ